MKKIRLYIFLFLWICGILSIFLISCKPPHLQHPMEIPCYNTDGRLNISDIYDRYQALISNGRWHLDTILMKSDTANGLEISYPVIALKTIAEGPAFWLITGIHGEEPAGPNAFAQHLDLIDDLAKGGVPMVVLPLCNPRGYKNNWRYNNTHERDWKLGGYSVSDSEHLLLNPNNDTLTRIDKAVGPDADVLTKYVLECAKTHRPLIVIDFHEDELSVDGGYIYSQGINNYPNPRADSIVSWLQSTGIPLRLAGNTRFNEPIENGIIYRDHSGQRLVDGSIDEMLGTTTIKVNGKLVDAPKAHTVIVIETPANKELELEKRVKAHTAILQHLTQIWTMK